jgi:outer membrane protein assembly factor BamE|tara:strand:+ start:214 stop:564 length:351 start_codon:yes stop_codon:yes gene_type:complete
METNNKLKRLKLFFIFIIFLTVTSCASLSPYKVPILQGNLFEEEDIEKLSEGLSKEQVQFIFGTALLKDPFHSNRWDYYYSIKVGTDILTESKLSILFDEDGLVDSWTIEKMEESN